MMSEKRKRWKISPGTIPKCNYSLPPIHFYEQFFLDFIYLFLDKGREGEREEEKHQCVVAFQVRPTGDVACNLSTYPDWESNYQLDSQASTQSTEPHQPGQL